MIYDPWRRPHPLVCPEIHGLDDVRRGIICEVCGYGSQHYFPSQDDLLEGILFGLVLLVVVAVMFLAFN